MAAEVFALTTQLAFNEERWTVPLILSETSLYRYLFSWRWDDGPADLYVGLNPSRATATVNDHTVLKWRGFSQRAGRGGFEVVNAFALRSTDPRGLLASLNPAYPVGPDNDWNIQDAATRADRIIACWGNPPAKHLVARLAHVQMLLRLTGKPLFCWGFTSLGHPRHPLMLGYSTPLEVFGT